MSSFNKKKRPAPSASKDVAHSKKKSSHSDNEKNKEDFVKDSEVPPNPPNSVQLFDEYTTTDPPGFIICVIDTFANPAPPQFTLWNGIPIQGEQKSEFFTYQLDGGVTRDFADHSKQVHSMRFSVAGKTGLELKLVFGRHVRKGSHMIEYGAVTFCQAVLWAEAFFSVEIDERYSKIINRALSDYNTYVFEKAKEKDIQMGRLPRLWKHDTDEMTFKAGTMRGELLSLSVLSGFCELVRGHFVAIQK